MNVTRAATQHEANPSINPKKRNQKTNAHAHKHLKTSARHMRNGETAAFPFHATCPTRNLRLNTRAARIRESPRAAPCPFSHNSCSRPRTTTTTTVTASRRTSWSTPAVGKRPPCDACPLHTAQPPHQMALARARPQRDLSLSLVPLTQAPHQAIHHPHTFVAFPQDTPSSLLLRP